MNVAIASKGVWLSFVGVVNKIEEQFSLIKEKAEREVANIGTNDIESDLDTLLYSRENFWIDEQRIYAVSTHIMFIVYT